MVTDIANLFIDFEKGDLYKKSFFAVEITVRGPIDQRTGMVVNITELKDAIETVIMKRLDHKNLDKDVEYFAKTVNLHKPLPTYQN